MTKSKFVIGGSFVGLSSFARLFPPLSAIPRQRLRQPLFKRYRRIVAEIFSGAGNVREREADVAGSWVGVFGRQVLSHQLVQSRGKIHDGYAFPGADVVDLAGD